MKKLESILLDYKIRDFILPLGEGIVTNVLDNYESIFSSTKTNTFLKLAQYIPFTAYHLAYNYLLKVGYDSLMDLLS